MSEYTITIEGYESGLTQSTVAQMIREQFGGPNVEISVENKDESDDGKLDIWQEADATAEEVSVVAYSEENGTVVVEDEVWFTWDELELIREEQE